MMKIIEFLKFKKDFFIEIFSLVLGSLMMLGAFKLIGLGLVLFADFEKLAVGIFLFFIASKLMDLSFSMIDDLLYSREFKKTGDDFENRYNLIKNNDENN